MDELSEEEFSVATSGSYDSKELPSHYSLSGSTGVQEPGLRVGLSPVSANPGPSEP